MNAAPARDPFHRTSDDPRGGEHDSFLRIRVALHAEAAADIRPDHAQFRFGNMEDRLCQRFANPVRILRAGIERKALIHRVVLANSATGLHRARRHPVVGQPQPHAMCSAHERFLGLRRIAHLQGEADIVRGRVPHRRRALGDCIGKTCDARKDFVVDLDQLRGVASLRERLRDAKSHAIADVPHDLAGEQRAHRAVPFGPAGVLWHKKGRQAAKFMRRNVLAGKDRQHARRTQRLRAVNRLDPRVRVVRVDEDTVGYGGKIDIIQVTAASAEQFAVLYPGQRLAKPSGGHRREASVLW
jgi:hypothetical protein